MIDVLDESGAVVVLNEPAMINEPAMPACKSKPVARIRKQIDRMGEWVNSGRKAVLFLRRKPF